MLLLGALIVSCLDVLEVLGMLSDGVISTYIGRAHCVVYRMMCSISTIFNKEGGQRLILNS